MKHVKCYQQGYPRPQLVRKDWLDLNGEWLFAFGEDTTVSEALAGNLKRKIRVPYSYETEMSGIGDTSQHNTVWYSRTIEGKMKKRQFCTLKVPIMIRPCISTERASVRIAVRIRAFPSTSRNISLKKKISLRFVVSMAIIPVKFAESSGGVRRALVVGMCRRRVFGRAFGWNMSTRCI